MNDNGTGKSGNGTNHVRIPSKKITKVINLTKDRKLRPRTMAVWTFLFSLSKDPTSPHPVVEMSTIEMAKALKIGKTTMHRCVKELVAAGLVKPIYRVGFMRNRDKLFQFTTFKEAREFSKTRKANMFEAHYQL